MKSGRFPLVVFATLLAVPAMAQVAQSDRALSVHRDAESCWVETAPDAVGVVVSMGRGPDRSWLRFSGRDWPFKADGAYLIRIDALAEAQVAGGYRDPTEQRFIATGVRDPVGRVWLEIQGRWPDMPPSRPSIPLYRDTSAVPFATIPNLLAGNAAKGLSACAAELYSAIKSSGLPAVVPPMPLGTPASWLTGDDYPSAALRAEDSGLVAFELKVDALGRPSDCKVTASSGSALLDTTTCALMRRRGRFIAARDADGNRTEGSFVSMIRWAIRGD